MQTTVRPVVETPIRLVKVEIDPEAVLVAADDVFEAPRVPSLILPSPTLLENGDRRNRVEDLEGHEWAFAQAIKTKR